MWVQKYAVMSDPLAITITYSVFLDSSSIGTVDDIDEGKGLRQIPRDYFIHNIRLANARTVNNNDAFLKYKKMFIRFVKMARPGFLLTIPTLFEQEIQRCLKRNRKSSYTYLWGVD